MHKRSKHSHNDDVLYISTESMFSRSLLVVVKSFMNMSKQCRMIDSKYFISGCMFNKLYFLGT